MKHYEDLELMTYYKEKLLLPFNQEKKYINSLFFTLNTSNKAIADLFNDSHNIISNVGGIYKTFYCNWKILPDCIKSNRIKSKVVTMADAKKLVLADYAEMADLCTDVITPIIAKDKGKNIIYSMNILTDLYNKQPKLRSLPLQEKVLTYFTTIDSFYNQKVTTYTNNCILVNLDEYTPKTANNHIITYIILALKRNDKFLDKLNYDFRILFYNSKGYFLFDMKKNLVKSNIGIFKKLLTRLNVSLNSVDGAIDRIEKAEVQRYLAVRAVKANFDGDPYGDIEDLDPDDILDGDSDIVNNISNKLDDVDDLSDDESGISSKIDYELKADEDLKRQMTDALAQKSTGKKKTEASLKRDEMLREQQKNIKVKTKTLGELSSEKTIPVLKTHKIELDSVTNENMKNMKFTEFNKTYMEEVYEKDIANMINCISQDKSIQVHVVDVKVGDTSDELTLKETYTVTLEDENRRRHTMKFALPKVIDNEFIYINGSKKTIANQFMMYPVIKTSEDTVQICTNYNKIFISRVGNKFSANSEKFRKLMEQHGDLVKVTKGCNTSANKPYLTYLEYDEFAKSYNTIEIGNAVFDFSTKRLLEMFPNYKEKLDEYIVGYYKNKKSEPIIYKPKESGAEDFVSFMVSFINNDEIFDEYAHYTTGKKFVHTKATLMAKHVPTIVVICYFEGLTTVIRKFNDSTVVYTDKIRDRLANNYIKFMDGYLEYPKSNMEACMLFNGLAEFNTANYTIGDMDNRVTYLDIFNELFGSGASMADALLNYYDWMIDPISYEILELLNYPTDIVSLMIFANKMLADSHYTTDIDLNQYRIRSFEVISAILYKNIAKSYSRYRRTANNPNPVKITMDENAVIKELVTIPTIEDYSELSPMVELHKQGLVSMKGANGLNLDRAYKLDKRAYHDSMIGVVGVSTDNAGNCGKIKQLVAEPTVVNARGFMELNNRQDVNKLTDVNLSTPVELLTPMTVTNDDPNRTIMTTKQTSHVIPVENNCPALVSTGMDQMAHYRTGSDFSVVAKEDGKVLTIDEENEIMIVQYKSGEKHAIDLSKHVVKNGGGGFYLVNQLVPKVKNNATFKKDAILAYDPKYYKEQDVFGNRMTMGSLQKVAIMSNYATYEDSNFITKQFSESMATNITMPHKVIIGQNANVDYIVNVGDRVVIGDDLIRYETSYDDDELNKMLGSIRDETKEEIINLGKSQVHAHYTGEVSDIDIVSTVDPSELSPSLRKIVEKYQGKISKKKKLLDSYDKDSKNQAYRMNMHIKKSDSVTKPDEYGKVQGDNVGNGVRIIFYITYHDEMSDGDKMAGWTANKNTIGYQVPKGFEPYSEFRPYEEVSSTQAPSAILQRGTPSVVTTGTAYKVLIELKRKMYEILTGENFDEVLKQKQPWMNQDRPTMESVDNIDPIVDDNQIQILENVFNLYKDANNHYRSEKMFAEGDIILTVNESVNMFPMLDNFYLSDRHYNAILEDGFVRATKFISPNEKINLHI